MTSAGIGKNNTITEKMYLILTMQTPLVNYFSLRIQYFISLAWRNQWNSSGTVTKITPGNQIHNNSDRKSTTPRSPNI
jgi:hypothetical protein